MANDKEQNGSGVTRYLREAIMGGLLMIGAWYFNGINGSVERLATAVGDLKTEIAVLKTTSGEMDRLRTAMDAIRAEQARQATTLSVILQRLTAIESR